METSGFRTAGVSLALKHLTREELNIITDNFDPKNLIGHTHFGEVFKGVYRHTEVTVKLWGFITSHPKIRISEETFSRNRSRFDNEVDFLSHPSNIGRHCIPKLFAQFLDEKSRLFAVVYEFASSDTLPNVTTNDEFSWMQRIKVARDLALLLEFLHGQEPPYRVCNLDPINIMLGKSQKPMLIDFSFVIRKDRIPDDNIKDGGLVMNGFLDFQPLEGLCFVENDAYSFGLLPLGLISKHVQEHVLEIDTFYGTTIEKWVIEEYVLRNSIDGSNSLAHNSFKEEAGFDDGYATKITKLAMRCLRKSIHWRPSMKLFARLLDNPFAPEFVDGITSDILFDGYVGLEKISLADLEASAETFSDKNMIGFTQFGALYKGAVKFDGCIVKTWGRFDSVCHKTRLEHVEYSWFRFKNEIKFLKNPPFESPSFPKLKAYFCDEGKDMFAVVYDLASTDHDTLWNLMTKDDFTWTHRIKVALDLARVIEKLHCQNYMILDLDWSTIMLNKMGMPILADFSLITTTNRGSEQWEFKFYGRLLVHGLHHSGIMHGLFDVSDDVYSFASIVLGLISKHLRVKEFTMLEWAANEYKRRFSVCSKLCSVADDSFENEPGYDVSSAAIITKMASACLHPTAGCRPSIKVVVKALEACQSISQVKLNQRSYAGASDYTKEGIRMVIIPCCFFPARCLTRFTEEDLNTMFCKKILVESNGYKNIYLGTILPDKYVTVKTWNYDSSIIDIFLLSLPEVRKSHHFPVLIGYHKSSSCVSLVYYFQVKGTLQSLIKEDAFTWAQRISVARSIAESLASFDALKLPYLTCKIDAEDILLDQNFKPILTEFGMVTNGNFSYKMDGTTTSYREESVRSFGVILSSLISKNEGLNSDPTPVVHQSLAADPGYDAQLGVRMAALALQCLDTDLTRPREIIKYTDLNELTMDAIIHSFPRDVMMICAKRSLHFSKSRLASAVSYLVIRFVIFLAKFAYNLFLKSWII